MSVKLNSSGGGSVTLQEPSTASNVTLTLPATTGTVALQGGAGVGKVLQVVQGTYNTNGSTTSTSYVDTGLNASITPSSSSSKVLVLVSQSAFAAGASQGQATLLNIVRGSTQIWETLDQAFQTYDQGGSGVEIGGYASMHYLDSPATTSSTTYKTQIKRSGGSESRWRSGTIILMEIAA